jgi:hypothetical protein
MHKIGQKKPSCRRLLPQPKTAVRIGGSALNKMKNLEMFISLKIKNTVYGDVSPSFLFIPTMPIRVG